jgi:hypothetical protein
LVAKPSPEGTRRVLDFPNVEEYTLHAELEVTEVLFQRTDGAFDMLTEGPVLVGAYDGA